MTATIDFADIFRFADKYGVSWNEANDIFFDNVFSYDRIVEYCGDWENYVSFYKDVKATASDYTVDEVKVMSTEDKAHIITAVYMETLDLEGVTSILIDAS